MCIRSKEHYKITRKADSIFVFVKMLNPGFPNSKNYSAVDEATLKDGHFDGEDAECLTPFYGPLVVILF